MCCTYIYYQRIIHRSCKDFVVKAIAITLLNHSGKRLATFYSPKKECLVLPDCMTARDACFGSVVIYFFKLWKLYTSYSTV